MRNNNMLSRHLLGIWCLRPQPWITIMSPGLKNKCRFPRVLKLHQLLFCNGPCSGTHWTFALWVTWILDSGLNLTEYWRTFFSHTYHWRVATDFLIATKNGTGEHMRILIVWPYYISGGWDLNGCEPPPPGAASLSLTAINTTLLDILQCWLECSPIVVNCTGDTLSTVNGLQYSCLTYWTCQLHQHLTEGDTDTAPIIK